MDASNVTVEIPPVHFPKDMLGFTAACAFIIAILGTFGNLLTIFALPMYRKLRTTTTAFVINLAVVELLFCICILPMTGAQYAYLMYHDASLLSDHDCRFFAAARYTFTQVEIQTIIAIALTRAVAVGNPRLYQRLDNRYIVGIYIAIIWLYSFFWKLPIVLGVFGSYVFNNRTMECDMGSDPASMKARGTMLYVEAFVPVLLILVLYLFIFIRVKMSSRRVAKARIRNATPSTTSTTDSTTDSGNRKGSMASIKNLKRMLSDSNLKMKIRRSSSTCSTTSRRDMRVARTIFIIFMMVLVCSVPVAVIHAIDYKVTQPRRFLGVHILYWMQYCLNMVVYVLMNRQYRVAYIELLAKVLPSWGRYKDFSFPWENPSISSKPAVHGPSNSIKSHQDSYSQDPNAAPKEYKPANPLMPHRPGPRRLSDIIEVNSSSCVSHDDVFEHERKTPEKERKNDNDPENPKEPSSSTFKDHAEEGTEQEKEHWVSQNGQTIQSPVGGDCV